MLTACKTWLREADRNYLIFLLASVFLGIGQSVDGATLTNYLKKAVVLIPIHGPLPSRLVLAFTFYSQIILRPCGIKI